MEPEYVIQGFRARELAELMMEIYKRRRLPKFRSGTTFARVGRTCRVRLRESRIVGRFGHSVFAISKGERPFPSILKQCKVVVLFF